jgi:hypothetical protein
MGQGRRGDKTDSDSDREPEPIEFAMQMSYDGYCKSYKQLREHRRELQRSFADQIQLSKAQRKRLIVKAEAAFQGIEKDGRQYLQWYLELERQDRPRKWYDYRKAKKDIEMVREFDAAIKDPEKVQQKTWSEVSSDHTITHDGSFHGSRISEIGFTGREDAERAYAHAKAEREARIAMYFAEREKTTGSGGSSTGWRHTKSSTKRTSIGSNDSGLLNRSSSKRDRSSRHLGATTESGDLTPTARRRIGGGVPTFVGL